MPDDPSGPQPQDDGYVVVARRYRPRGFDELVGQDHVGQALKNAIETNRVGHAYLFTGARGVGKTSTARIFAKALNNPGGASGTPDQQSDTAQAIDAGEDVDVIEIDGASNRGIDEIRSLRANVGVRPSRSRFKIYIIDEVHMLTGQAFNALLKTLEEPPEHVKFIFCTTDPEKIPITVLSRCQRFDFAPVEVAKIVKRLSDICEAENAEADPAALELIARRASGSMRDSQSLLEQVLSFSAGKLTADSVHQMLGTADDQRLHDLAKSLADRDASAALRQLDAAVDAGVDAGRLAEQLLGYFRDLMAVTVGCEPSMQRHTSAGLHEELKQLGERWGLQTVLAVVGLIDETLVRIRHSVYARVLLESTLIQICHLPDLQAIADLAEAAKSLPPHAKLSSASDAEKKKGPPKLVQAEPAAADAGPSGKMSKTPAPAATQQKETHRVSNVDPPETPKAETVAAKANTLGEAEVMEAWQQSLSEMDPMTATLARSVSETRLTQPGQIQLTFPATSGLAMGRCDRPEHRKEIVDTLRRLTGQEFQLNIIAAARVAKSVVKTTEAPAKSRMQRMRDIEANPLVQACKEVFDAEVIKVDLPRP